MGMAHTQLAEMLGFSSSSILEYEAGVREPKLSSIFRIANCLEVNYIRLLMSKEEEEQRKMEQRKRYNLLVTAGARAAYMDCAGKIELPTGVEGEDKLARFVKNRVDAYMKENIDISFDEYIEGHLEQQFGKN